MSRPQYFQQPLRYMRWASHEKPAIFYSVVIGAGGPLSFVVAPPIRRMFNDGPRERIPLTYPSKLSVLGSVCTPRRLRSRRASQLTGVLQYRLDLGKYRRDMTTSGRGFSDRISLLDKALGVRVILGCIAIISRGYSRPWCRSQDRRILPSMLREHSMGDHHN